MAKLSVAEQLEGRQRAESQFERAMRELGVGVRHAHSPQAKGRVERLFKSLQDRLVKEMRLKDIATQEQANKFLKAYLPLYNKRFRVAAANRTDMHRTIPMGLDLNAILCVKTQRALRNDYTVVHDKKLYQILKPVKTKQVIIEQRMDGSLCITHKGGRLPFKEIITRPVKETNAADTPVVLRARKKYIPPPEHPWRNYGKNRSTQTSPARYPRGYPLGYPSHLQTSLGSQGDGGSS
jgi:hypothetical protein